MTSKPTSSAQTRPPAGASPRPRGRIPGAGTSSRRRRAGRGPTRRAPVGLGPAHQPERDQVVLVTSAPERTRPNTFRACTATPPGRRPKGFPRRAVAKSCGDSSKKLQAAQKLQATRRRWKTSVCWQSSQRQRNRHISPPRLVRHMRQMELKYLFPVPGSDSVFP